MGPGALSDVLAGLRLQGHANLIIGLDVSDDAAVWRVSDELALVQTVDFFPPIVDDPYAYGAIAAANALSDIYAMGGAPAMALVIAAFPADLPAPIIQAILQGGADKAAEAGAVIGGGHTVVDKEPKYGLCATGFVHPDRITPKGGAVAGDRLLLTKPLGTGAITTAIKRGKGDQAHLAAAVESMLLLNRAAAELARGAGVHGATDITGFGLLGHAAELARNSQTGLRIESASLPLLPGALDYARAGIVPGGLANNRAFVEQSRAVRYAPGIDQGRQLLLFDPQTSGGLLFALPPAAAAELRARFAAAGHGCWEIGEVTADETIAID